MRDVCVCDMVLWMKREDKTLQGKILVVCVRLHKFDHGEIRLWPSMESNFGLELFFSGLSLIRKSQAERIAQLSKVELGIIGHQCTV